MKSVKHWSLYPKGLDKNAQKYGLQCLKGRGGGDTPPCIGDWTERCNWSIVEPWKRYLPADVIRHVAGRHGMFYM